MLNQDERMLRLPEVRARTGLSTTAIYGAMNAGTFPRPRQIGVRSVAWLQSELVEWMQRQPGGGYRDVTRASEPAVNSL